MIDLRNKETSFVVAVVFIVPILLLATHEYIQDYRRTNQLRTMVEIRALSTAVECYAADHKHYPPGNSTSAQLKKYLEPKYIAGLPTKDYWGNDFRYYSAGQQSYTIMSYGKDHVQDAIPNVGIMTSFNQDMVLVDGVFTSQPDGT